MNNYLTLGISNSGSALPFAALVALLLCAGIAICASVGMLIVWLFRLLDKFSR